MKSTYLKTGTNSFLQLWHSLAIYLLTLILSILPVCSFPQANDVSKKMKGFDQYMDKVLKDWNIAGAGVGIVYKNKLVFAKGYGYREYEQKLPVTPNRISDNIY